MIRAKQDAIKNALRLGMNVDFNEISLPQLKGTNLRSGINNDQIDEENDDCVIGNNDEVEPEDPVLGCSNLKDYSHVANTTNSSGAFVTIPNSNLLYVYQRSSGF